MRRHPHIALLALALCGVMTACFVPDYQRECRQNRDCRDGQICRFSNCVVPAASTGDNNAALECRPEQIACDGRCITCAQEPNASLNGCRNGSCAYLCEGDYKDTNQNLGEGFDGCECSPSGEEVCDGLDNDCDGLVDEGAPLTLCPARPNTNTIGCSQGICLFNCDPGKIDLNRDLASGLQSDGCECSTSEQERCDGVDNDCDGMIDEGATLELCPPVQSATATGCDLAQGACRYACAPGRMDLNDDLALRERGDGCECVESLCNNQEGVCEGATRGCDLPQDQECPDASFQAHAAGRGQVWQEGVETRCDRQDNNCDGVVDELCCGFEQSGAIDLLAQLPEANMTRLAVAWSPDLSRYAVVSADGASVYAVVVSGDGQQVADFYVFSNSGGAPMARWQRDHFEVFWAEGGALRRRDLSLQGQSNGIPPSLPMPRGALLGQDRPRLTRGEDQTIYLIAQVEGTRGHELLRLHPSGAVLGRMPLETSAPLGLFLSVQSTQDQVFVLGLGLAEAQNATAQTAIFVMDTAQGDLRDLRRWEGVSLPLGGASLQVGQEQVHLLRQRPAFQNSPNRVDLLLFDRALGSSPTPSQVIVTLSDAEMTLQGALWGDAAPEALLLTHPTQGGLLWGEALSPPTPAWEETEALDQLSVAPHALGFALFGLTPDRQGRLRPTLRIVNAEGAPLCP